METKRLGFAVMLWTIVFAILFFWFFWAISFIYMGGGILIWGCSSAVISFFIATFIAGISLAIDFKRKDAFTKPVHYGVAGCMLAFLVLPFWVMFVFLNLGWYQVRSILYWLASTTQWDFTDYWWTLDNQFVIAIYCLIYLAPLIASPIAYIWGRNRLRGK